MLRHLALIVLLIGAPRWAMSQLVLPDHHLRGLRKGEKVSICHFQDDESTDLLLNFKTLSVSVNALNGHGQHELDDLTGPCECEEICGSIEFPECRLVQWEESSNGCQCLAGEPESACGPNSHCGEEGGCVCDDGYSGDPATGCELDQQEPEEYFCLNRNPEGWVGHEILASDEFIGGHLASIRSQEENDQVYAFITEQFAGSTSPDHIYLGGHDQTNGQSDGNWEWVDGSGTFWEGGFCNSGGHAVPGVYENFYCNRSTEGIQQPSRSDERCLDMFAIWTTTIPYSSYWNDLDCSRLFPGIYRIPASGYDMAVNGYGLACVEILST